MRDNLVVVIVGTVSERIHFRKAQEPPDISTAKNAQSCLHTIHQIVKEAFEFHLCFLSCACLLAFVFCVAWLLPYPARGQALLFLRLNWTAFVASGNTPYFGLRGLKETLQFDYNLSWATAELRLSSIQISLNYYPRLKDYLGIILDLKFMLILYRAKFVRSR